MGKVVNNIRKKIAKEDIKKQLKELLKQWQQDYLKGSNNILQNGEQQKRKLDNSNNNIDDVDSQEREPKRIRKCLSGDNLDGINKVSIAYISIPRCESLPIINNESNVSSRKTAFDKFEDNFDFSSSKRSSPSIADGIDSTVDNSPVIKHDNNYINEEHDVERSSSTKVKTEDKFISTVDNSAVHEFDTVSNERVINHDILSPVKTKELNTNRDIKHLCKRQVNILSQLLNSISELEAQAESNFVKKKSVKLQLDWKVKNIDSTKVEQVSNNRQKDDKVDGVHGRYAFNGTWCEWNVPMATPNSDLVVLPYIWL